MSVCLCVHCSLPLWLSFSHSTHSFSDLMPFHSSMSTRQVQKMRKRVKNKRGPEFEEEKLVMSIVNQIPSLSFQGLHFSFHVVSLP